jgi:hypothetical protein
MKHVQVALEFMQIQVSGPDDILQWMERIAGRKIAFWKADESRLLPPETWASMVTDEIRRGIEKWEHYKRTEPKSLRYISKWWVTFCIHFEDLPDFYVLPHFSVEQIDDRMNRLEIGGLIDFEFRDERPLLEPFAQRLLELGHLLYPLVRPEYGYLDEAYANPMLSKDVLKRRLKHISWVNFFGPAYVEKYGQDFLLGLPGYKTEPLPDGGVFHQLSPTFVAPSEQEAKRLRQEVIAYCARHGLQVTCRAPFVIPGLTLQPKPKEPVSDAELQAYLAQILSITLVLDDGTRVKHLYIPWDDLTPQQRQMAVEAIRQAAIAEIKRPDRKRIRLEFNEIPDELDQVLAALAGRDNPEFEWVEVEMGL